MWLRAIIQAHPRFWIVIKPRFPIHTRSLNVVLVLALFTAHRHNNAPFVVGGAVSFIVHENGVADVELCHIIVFVYYNMIRYFAYGHNTNSAEFIQRIPPAILVGKACLPKHALVMREYADIVPTPADKVWGVLWDIPAGWLSELDAIEQEYAQKNVRVKYRNATINAMVYFMYPTQPTGRPTKKYVNYLKQGYEEHKLPLGQLHRALKAGSTQ